MKRNIEYTERQYICCCGWDKNYCSELSQAMSACPDEGKLRQVTALVGEEGDGMRSLILCRTRNKLSMLDEFRVWIAAL